MIGCTRCGFDFVIIDGPKASLFRAGHLAERLQIQANFTGKETYPIGHTPPPQDHIRRAKPGKSLNKR